jgi:hypothetical protein
MSKSETSPKPESPVRTMDAAVSGFGFRASLIFVIHHSSFVIL